MLGELDKEVKKKIYLSISRGKVVHYLNGGGVEYYKNIVGNLEKIYLKERVFNGNKFPFWYMDLRDGKDLYSLSLPYESGTFKSIVLSLASDEALSKSSEVLIEPYQKKQFTKVVVYIDGVKTDWVTKELPEPKTIQVDGKEFTDYSERMKLIGEYVDKINSRLDENAEE